MKIKVCGMRQPDNIRAISLLEPDYLGFIFYEKSARFVNSLLVEALSIPSQIKKTGVFVNKCRSDIDNIIKTYNLNAVQLHGNETPDDCAHFKDKGIEVIKAISIFEKKNLDKALPYYDACNFLLFDTSTPNYGGSGKKFDWDVLAHYNGSLPFFLSGGISPDDLNDIKEFEHPLFYGIDINSKFEVEPGIKNVTLVADFISKIRSIKIY